MKSLKFKKIFKNLFVWKKGLLVDAFLAAAFFSLNLVYLFPFFGEADKSNIFSAPLIPFLSRLISWLTGLQMTQSITVSLLIFLSLGPTFIYFFTLKLTGRRLSSFLAGLLYSLPLELFAKGRIKMAFLVGDGGHIASLTLVPIVVLFLLTFLQKGSFKSLALASLWLALVALVSPFGLLVGTMVLMVIAFSEFLQGDGRLKILRFVIFLGLMVGFVAFWYDPGFVILFLKSRHGIVIGRTFWNLVPLSFVVVPALGAFGFLLFEKKSRLQTLFIALGLVALFSLVSFADHVGRLFPSHPRRYLPVLGFSVSFLFGTLLTALSDYLRFRGKIYKVRLNPLGRSLAQKTLWLSSLGVMGMMIIFSMGSIWQLPESQVLGLWDEGVVLGGAWEIKRQTKGISAWFGYLVTGLTGILVISSWLRIRKEK